MLWPSQLFSAAPAITPAASGTALTRRTPLIPGPSLTGGYTAPPAPSWSTPLPIHPEAVRRSARSRRAIVKAGSHQIAPSTNSHPPSPPDSLAYRQPPPSGDSTSTATTPTYRPPSSGHGQDDLSGAPRPTFDATPAKSTASAPGNGRVLSRCRRPSEISCHSSCNASRHLFACIIYGIALSTTTSS